MSYIFDSYDQQLSHFDFSSHEWEKWTNNIFLEEVEEEDKEEEEKKMKV